MSQDEKLRYRRLRNLCGWVLAVLWIVYWYGRLDAEQQAALAALQDCDALSGAKWLACKGGRGVDSTAASFAFGGQMLFVVLAAPFAFLVARYPARAIVQYQIAAAARNEARAAEAREREEEELHRQRVAMSEAAAHAAKQAIERGEFIRKLGSVSDLLDLLPIETDAARVALIRQSIAKELRDLVAKHSPAELRALVASDESIRLLLGAVLDHLKRERQTAGMLPSVLAATLPAAGTRGR